MGSLNKVFTRQPRNPDKKLSEYIYEHALLCCESSEINRLKGARIDCNQFTKATENNVNVSYNKPQKIAEKYFDIPTKKQRWTIKTSINISKLNNEVIFISSGNKIISLLKHIRNAYAHNNVVIDANNNIIIGDFLTTKKEIDFNKPTMVGKLSVENFKLLISTIESFKK